MAHVIASAMLLLLAATCQAQGFKTVGIVPIVLYDMPSVKSVRLFVAPRAMPLEVMLAYGDWVKARRCATSTATWPGPGSTH
jgi:hypothetical protein